MADSCQGGSTDAAARRARGEDADDWELLPRPQSRAYDEDGGDGRHEAATFRDERGHRGEADGEPTTRADKGRRSNRHDRGIPARLLAWVITRRSALFHGYVFGFLPVMASLQLEWIKDRPRLLQLPAGELLGPAFFPPHMSVMLSLLFHAFLDGIIYAIVQELREGNQGAVFGGFVYGKLLLRTWLLFGAGIRATTYVLKMIRQHLVTSATLDTREMLARKCLGHLGCLPRTLPDLYGSNTCAGSALWQKQLGHSRDDILSTASCLYEVVSAAEKGVPIQMNPDSYGTHMQSFVGDNVLWACVVAYALCAALPEIFTLSEVVSHDVAAAVLHNACTRKRHQEAATWRQAFLAASLECLRTTRYEPVDETIGLLCLHGSRSVMRFMRAVMSTIKDVQQPSSQPSTTMANNAQSRAVGCS